MHVWAIKLSCKTPAKPKLALTKISQAKTTIAILGQVIASSRIVCVQFSILLVYRSRSVMPRGWSKSGLAHSFLEALLAQPSQPPRNPWVTVTRKRHPGNQPSVVQVKGSTSKGKRKGTSSSPMPKPLHARVFRSHPQKPTRELSGHKQLSQQWATWTAPKLSLFGGFEESQTGSLQVLWGNASTVVRNLSDEPRSVCRWQTRLC